MASLGIGKLILPQKPWATIDAELALYRRIYRDVNQTEAPNPILAGWVFCDPGEKRARAVRWIGGHRETALRRFEFGGEHFAKTKGYEFYAAMSEAQRASAAQAAEAYLALQVWSTPAMCYDCIVKNTDRMNSEHFSCVFNHAGMPYAEAERNLRLFAREVMPKLRKI